jgi:hypothetical protein
LPQFQPVHKRNDDTHFLPPVLLNFFFLFCRRCRPFYTSIQVHLPAINTFTQQQMPPSTSKSISRSQGISRTSCSSFPAPLLAHLRLPLLLLLLTVFLAQQPGGGPSSVAMALPVSMLNSLSNFYPLSALLRGREEPPRLALVVVKGAGREASSESRMLTPVQPVELAASSRREPLLSNIAAISSQTVRPTKPQKFGTLKLCPPGKSKRESKLLFFFKYPLQAADPSSRPSSWHAR